MVQAFKGWKGSICDLNPSILWGVLKKKRWKLIFIKGVKGFEAKKAINHELEAHGYSSCEEEDVKYNDVCVCVGCEWGREKEDESVCDICRRSGGD